MMRFGFTPLYTSFADVWDAVEILRRSSTPTPTTSPPRAARSPEKDTHVRRSEMPAAEWHGAKLDFSNAMSYGDYLGLDQILNAQHPRSPNHNELLFIVQHQTSELWMKLMLHELQAVRANMRAGELAPAMKMLARVARIMNQLVHAWDVLATMTPPEYTAIRPYLGASSGFQSHQYREIEFILGNKNATLLCAPAQAGRARDPGARAGRAVGL